MESFIRRIRSRTVRRARGSDKNYNVQVPAEWAERMGAEGYTHVQVGEWRPGSNELMITPLREADVKQWQLERRRERNREASRRRYDG